MPLWGPASLVIITNLLTHRLLHPFFWLDPPEPWNHGRGLNPSVDGWKAQGKLTRFDVPVWIRSWLPLQVPLHISSLCESLGKTWHQKKHKGLSKPRSPGLTMPAPGWTHTWFEQRPGGSSDSLPRRSLLPADCSLDYPISFHHIPGAEPHGTWDHHVEALPALASVSVMSFT